MSISEIRTVSIAAPAYNESASIREIVREWLDYLGRYPGLEDFEIVICNDGSRDATGAILDELAAADRHVKPVHFAQNQGAAAALTTAIRHTTLEWVLLIDTDGQYKIETLASLAQTAQSSGCRAVMGMRLAKEDSFVTRFGSAMSGSLCNWFHRTHIRDFNCALKLVDGDVVRALHLEARGLNYSADVTSKLIEHDVQIAETPVEHGARESGRSSSQNLRSMIHRIWFVLYLGYRQFLIRNGILQRPSLTPARIRTRGV